MELKEIVAPPVVHKTPNENCPFCPPPDVPDLTTYSGAKNNSGVLADVMDKPSDLLAKQSGARPQTSRVDANGFVQEQSTPKPRKYDAHKPYTFQAHHLISGNQALKGEPMEDWILASGRNEKQTGYSINCTGNGFWAPSTPKKYVGRWSASKRVLDDDERQSAAAEVMKDFGAQIHIGPHNIADPDDPDGAIHFSYDKYIKGKLAEIDSRIGKWKNGCFLCKPSKKPQATHHVHDVLDNLSTHLEGKISGSRVKWDVFISKYALAYHDEVCRHSPRKKKTKKR